MIVFPFEPDWSRPVRESIQYMTQVLTARTGMEQRFRLRHVPRRGLAFDLLNIGQTEVQRFASLVWDSQSDLFACPWWPDKIQYTGTIASGATVVTISTTNRLFTVSPMAVIWESPTKCEAVTISSATGTQINISATTQAYTNPLILPAFQGRLDSIDVSVLGLKASSASVKIQCEVSATDTRPSTTTPTQAYGLDVLTAEPNADGQRWASSRIVDRLDNGFGKVAVVDRGSVSFQSSDFNWFLSGRDEISDFRDLIDRRAGSLVPFWVPTWREDLLLAVQAYAPSSLITVHSCGYTASMYPDKARKYLAIRTPSNGWIYRKVTSASDDGTTEMLTLDSANGIDLPAGTIVSFLTLCRLSDDTAEIDWETPIFGQSMTQFVEIPKEVP